MIKKTEIKLPTDVKMSGAIPGSDLVLWTVHTPMVPEGLGQLYMSRDRVLSRNDKQMLANRGVMNYIDYEDCLWHPTNSTADDEFIPPSLDKFSGVWTVFATNFHHVSNPKVRCLTIAISRVSSKLYVTSSTFIDDETNEWSTQNYEAVRTEDGNIRVSFTKPQPAIAISSRTLKGNLVQWNVYNTLDSQFVGELYVSRNRKLSMEEKQKLASQAVENYIDNDDCSLRSTGMSTVQSSNYIFLCICLMYAINLAFPFGHF